jgi:hypothetical protein
MLYSTPLDGAWAFALDPQGRGTAERWFDRTLEDTILLPSSVDEARKTPLTVDGTMAHLSRRHPYIGQAWYQRSFTVLPEAAGLYHFLVLERPHGEVNLWLDGAPFGRDDSLSTENRFLLGPLKAGEHRLALMIDNGRFEAVGELPFSPHTSVAHSTTEHTQTNWNGVVGSLRIEARRASIERLDVFAPTREARIHVELQSYDPDIRHPTYWVEPHDDRLTLSFAIKGLAEPLVIERKVDINSAYVPLDVNVLLPNDAGLWDEFDPVVHRLTATWTRDGVIQDQRETSFGVRSFVSKDKRLRLNGRPVFLRGTLDCCIFPLTGYPPTDHAGWRKVFETVKAYGLNHVRYHSYCPPKAAFEVADEMGLLLHVETPIWAVLGGDPNLDRYIHAEAERIVRDYGNHPSFVMLCVGNEVHGSGLHAFLERFIEKWQGKDDRRVYTGGSGWPTTMRADYISKPEPRNHQWGEGLDSRLNARALETRSDFADWQGRVPMALVSHETGQWCVFPDLAEIDKYTGVVEARNFIAVRDDLERKGRLDQAHDLMMASGALQAQHYKEEMEAALRTRDFAGTQLLGLQDFPGQGTALVGVVDAFWDEKPYVSSEQFREFTAPIVPLLRADGFVLTRGEPFTALVQLAQFGPGDLAAATLTWQIFDDKGTERARGSFTAAGLATGHLHDIGEIRIETEALGGSAAYTVLVSLDGTEYRNRWSIWVFEPAAAPLPMGIVTTLDDSALARLAAGETLVLAPEPATLKPNAELGHTPIFWNTLWTRGQAPHTLGLLNDTAHPVFEHFPADTHSDWHWWELTHRRRALDIEGTPFKAIVRVIDDWNQNRDLVMLGEAQVGPGRLIICAMDLVNGLDSRPVARGFREALARFVARPAAPAADVAPSELSAWWKRVTA